MLMCVGGKELFSFMIFAFASSIAGFAVGLCENCRCEAGPFRSDHTNHLQAQNGVLPHLNGVEYARFPNSIRTILMCTVC